MHLPNSFSRIARGPYDTFARILSRPPPEPYTDHEMLGFHHFGTLLLFVASILLLVSTITSPVINSLALVRPLVLFHFPRAALT